MRLNTKHFVGLVENGEETVLLRVLVDDVADLVLRSGKNECVGEAVLEVRLKDLGQHIGVEAVVVGDIAVADEE